MRLPDYKTTAGNKIELWSFALGGGDERFYVQNTNEEECRAYAEALSEAGYELYSSNEMSAGENYIKRVNLAYSFVCGERSAFIFWDASLHTCFVTSTPKTALPAREKSRKTSGNTQKLVFSQIALTAGGMSYVARLSDGSFLIIDGGKPNDTDVENLYAFLKNDLTPEQKPRISMWFFTHAHTDHIGLAVKFLKRYKNDVEISAFAHQFPDCDKINVACDLPEEKEMMLALLAAIEENFPKATVYYMHTGERYYFSGAELEVLSSMDNSFPSLYFSLNDTSVITRLKFDSGKVVMLLADATHHQSRALAHTYGTSLKSDYLQMAHHGLIGGDIELYKLINPDVCLWCIKPECFSGTLSGAKYQWCIGEGGLEYNAWIRDGGVKPREHYDHTKTVSFEM